MALKDTDVDIRRSAVEKLLTELKASGVEEDIFIPIKECFESDDSLKMHEEWQNGNRWRISDIRQTIVANSPLFSNEEQFGLLTSALNFKDENYNYLQKAALTKLANLSQKEGFRDRVLEVIGAHFDHEADPEIRHAIVYQWGLEKDLPQVQTLLEKATQDENPAVRMLAQAMLNLK